jgi:hypothetical protein
MDEIKNKIQLETINVNKRKRLNQKKKMKGLYEFLHS